MERASGLRRVFQSLLFPDLDFILEATEQLGTRVDQLDKDILLVNKTLGGTEDALGQVDKGMVQLDHGMNRVDKELTLLGKNVFQLNRGLSVNVDELEQALNARIETLKVRFEAEHSNAMQELLSVTKVEPFSRTFENLQVFAVPDNDASTREAYESIELASLPEPIAPRKAAAPVPKTAAADHDDAPRPPRAAAPSWEKKVKPLEDASLEREPYADSATARHFAAVLEEIKQLRNGR